MFTKCVEEKIEKYRRPNYIFIVKWFFSKLRFVLGGIFIFSGLIKVIDLAGFAKHLHQFSFLPDWSILYLTFLIPAVEYSLGMCQVLGVFLKVAIPMLLGMLVVFTGALLYQMLQGHSTSCGCFGRILPELYGWWAIGRNGVLIVLLIINDHYFKIKKDNKLINFN